MAATNYLRLRKIQRLVYSGFTLSEVAKECGVSKKEVKANIDAANLSEEAKIGLKQLLKRNKAFSKKTLYIDTCGFKGANMKKVLERFPKVIVIREVIDEMGNYQFAKTDEWFGNNIRWFLGEVAHKKLKNVRVVSTDDVSYEAYTDNRLIDYLRKLPSQERESAIVLTNDNELSCKLQAYGVQYFGLDEIIQMQKEYNKLFADEAKKASQGNTKEASQADFGCKLESQENTEAQQVEKVKIPNTILLGKTLYLLDKENSIAYAGNGQIIGSSSGKLIPIKTKNMVLMLRRSKKKLKIHEYKVEDLLRECCGIDLGEKTVSNAEEIDQLDLPIQVKSKIRFYFAKHIKT